MAVVESWESLFWWVLGGVSSRIVVEMEVKVKVVLLLSTSNERRCCKTCEGRYRVTVSICCFVRVKPGLSF